MAQDPEENNSSESSRSEPLKRYQNIKYLAFEGGGGKAIGYLPAVRILERIGLLPFGNANSDWQTEFGTSALEGMSGTSGGSITVYFLSLGLNADEIDGLTKSGDFDKFYDDPESGFYKAVRYNPSTDQNESGFALDEYKEGRDGVTWSFGFQTLGYTKKAHFLITNTIDNCFYRTHEEALRIGDQQFATIFKKHGKFLLKHLVNTDLINFIAESKLQDIAASKKMVSKGKEGLIRYIYSLFFDRGIYSGSSVRIYFVELMGEALLKKFKQKFFEKMSTQLINIGIDVTNQTSVQVLESVVADKKRNEKLYQKYMDLVQHITYKEFVYISGCDLRISGTNTCTNMPREFSVINTPDFPVVDSVCLSMSIPFAFRPTFVNAIVHKDMYKSLLADYAGREVDTSDWRWKHLKSYLGFYYDGGATNNLPIHSFDQWKKVLREDFFAGKSVTALDHFPPIVKNPTANYTRTPEDEKYMEFRVMGQSVLGIRSTGGDDESFYYHDPKGIQGQKKYEKDDLYQEYFKLKSAKTPPPREKGEHRYEYGNRVNDEIPGANRILFGALPIIKHVAKDERYGNGKYFSTEPPYLLKIVNKAKGIFSTFGSFIGDTYNTIMYYTEDGQIRSEQERAQTIELHSYDIGLFDFDLTGSPKDVYLSAFAQRTAGMKFWNYLGIFESNTEIDREKYSDFLNKYLAKFKPQTKIELVSNDDLIELKFSPRGKNEFRIFQLLYKHYDISIVAKNAERAGSVTLTSRYGKSKIPD